MIFKHIKTLRILLKAWDAASLGDWELANDQLGLLASVAGTAPPDKAYPIEINILALQTAYFTCREEMAIATLNVCFDQIGINQRNDTEKYLAHFMKEAALACSNRFSGNSASFRSIASRIKIVDYNITKVSRTTINRVPMKSNDYRN